MAGAMAMAGPRARARITPRTAPAPAAFMIRSRIEARGAARKKRPAAAIAADADPHDTASQTRGGALRSRRIVPRAARDALCASWEALPHIWPSADDYCSFMLRPGRKASINGVRARGGRGDAGCAVCQRGARSCKAGRKCREETAPSRRRQHQFTRAPKAQRGDAQRQGPSWALAFFFSGLCDVSKTDGEAAVKPASKAATAWRCARRPGSPAGGRRAGSRCS